MPVSTARFDTPSASRYLQQLCKHWSHKLDVTFTSESGRVVFEPGREARFHADTGTLTIEVEAGDADTVGKTGVTVINHLKRFAFREDLGDVVWHDAD